MAAKCVSTLKNVKIVSSSVRALGRELIPVFKQSATRPAVKLVVVCHYLPPGLHITFPAAKHHCPVASTKLYCLMEACNYVNNLTKFIVMA